MLMTTKSLARTRKTTPPVVSAALLVAALAASGCSYNRFVTQEEAIKTQWAQVQNQLQRRNDLIPNLVETVKGYAGHEREVFEAVAASRARLAGATTPAGAIEAAKSRHRRSRDCWPSWRTTLNSRPTNRSID
jgi:hypothetical protein